MRPANRRGNYGGQYVPQIRRAALLRLTRLGVRAILLSDPVFAGSDTLATGYILSCALKKLRPDLILCGRQSIDGDTAQVGPCLSALLDIPVITNVMELPSLGIWCAVKPGWATVKRSCPACSPLSGSAGFGFPSLAAEREGSRFGIVV